MKLSWIKPRKLNTLGMLGMNCRNLEFIGRYNDRKDFPLVDDKLKTKLLASQHKLATPSLLFIIREQHEIRQIESQLAEKDSFVIKPAKGSGGKGILVITGRKGEHFIKSSGISITISDIRRHISNTLAGLYSLGGNSDVTIIEDLISFDDAFKGYSHEGVPDIRIIVFKGFPVMAMLRLATRASDGKANLHQGAVGVGLSLESGHCLQAVQYTIPIQYHPDTGLPLAKIKINNWREILILSARCGDMTNLGYIGADIVLNKQQGPQLLELNARPGLAIQIANGQGLLPRLRHVENIKKNLLFNAEQRVEYAMRKISSLE